MTKPPLTKQAKSPDGPPAAGISLRAVREQDVPQVLAFIRELAVYERLEHEVVATPELIRGALFGPRPYAECLFACLDGQPAGFALWFHNFSTFKGRPGLYLEDLYVRPAARGRGLGRRMLQELARLALARGCARFEWSVLDWNEPSIAFYRSLGAVPADDWTIYRVTGEALDRLAAVSPASGAG